jgi:hypothetical protein
MDPGPSPKWVLDLGFSRVRVLPGPKWRRNDVQRKRKPSRQHQVRATEHGRPVCLGCPGGAARHARASEGQAEQATARSWQAIRMMYVCVVQVQP